MTTIEQEDLIRSVADALQFISYYHPADYIAALGDAYAVEESPAAKDAIAQILTNSRMCAEGHRPICQDTGIVVAFVRVGMVGSAVPNSRLKQFESAIEEGRILVMADVPQHRVNEVREALHDRHPEAEDRGVDPHIPAFP